MQSDSNISVLVKFVFDLLSYCSLFIVRCLVFTSFRFRTLLLPAKACLLLFSIHGGFYCLPYCLSSILHHRQLIQQYLLGSTPSLAIYS